MGNTGLRVNRLSVLSFPASELRNELVLWALSELKMDKGEAVEFCNSFCVNPETNAIVHFGDLYIENKQLTKLPEELKAVFGCLSLDGSSKLQSLPETLDVEKSASFVGCSGLESIPQGVKASHFDFNGCTGLKTLPRGLETDYLNLEGCTSLKSLPAGLIIFDTLNLEGCSNLTSLPEDLEVRGWLRLGSCSGLKELPSTLKVRDCISIRNCDNLASLPESLRVTGEPDYPGCLIIENCLGLESYYSADPIRIRHLAAIAPRLDLRGWECLTSLPSDLNVEADLLLEGCPSLQILPSGLVIGRDLCLKNCASLKSIAEKTEVGRSLELMSCPKLEPLPNSILVNRLYIRDCPKLNEYYK